MKSFSTITNIRARQIFDSRGNPTVQVDLSCNQKIFTAAVPSGASTGKYQAVELRDNDKTRFLGKGVLNAVNNVNQYIAPLLKDKSVFDQKSLDQLMIKSDGTQNKAKFGANAILAVSLAIARAAADCKGIPLYKYLAQLAGVNKMILPVPSFNVINGGKHAGNLLAMQQFMILPTGANSFSQAMRMGVQVYHNLKKVIVEQYGQNATNVGDQGGFAPDIPDGIQALQLITKAISKAGYQGKIQIGTDCAASQFFDQPSKEYNLLFKSKDKKQFLNGNDLMNVYKQYCKKYPIISIEDPFDQDDWSSYTTITKQLGSQVQIVGDDLLVTNMKKIQQALKQKACNALLLKVNQIGSLSEAIQACLTARKNGWGTMVSHRSGQTQDTFIADLVVGLGTGQIKTGAPCRSQRVAKYNRLLRIQQELGNQCEFAGKKFKNPI